ncbi:MAG: putative hydrogenase nickel incorporation protein HypA [Candidatus Bathyarchaeota archaeon BA1]|nr:MAG: putative hydrogenase nickel incorporation protein HypA [Candidatus Bathyarchaeota archaeon BA1]
MHEFSTTSQIVQCILQEAEKHHAKKVLEVHLVIGKLTFLGLEQVRFAYEALVKGTIMEGSKLHIEEKDGVIKCANCGYKGDFQYQDDPMYHIPTPTLNCPKCRGIVEILGGKECLIKSIKLVMP